MIRGNYPAEELLQMGRKNYEKLIVQCELLEKQEFWEQAKKVMKQSSTEVLDRYVQSVLMNLVIRCGDVLENQKEYLSLITNTNPLEIEPGEEVSDDLVAECERYYTFPPILFQLCGMYDKCMNQHSGEEFLDACLNILLCMAYLNQGKDREIDNFIREYYEKIVVFLEKHETWNHETYLFHKLHDGRIVQATRWLHSSVRTDGSMHAAGAMVRQQMDDGKGGDSEQTILQEKDDSRQKTNDSGQETELQIEQELQEQREKQEQRDKQEKREQELAKQQFQLVKKRIQEREQAEKKEQEERLQKWIDELGALVGLQSVKDEIQSLVNLIRIRKLRESMNMQTMDMSYHMVFTGAPGTGKTTVARLVAKIYKELGILSEGTLVETDRSGLVAGYVGQTAIKVHELVEQAMGGVLFIDEAYSLVNPDVPNDFGMEAVDTLVKLMEDHRDNLVVIVAGYTKEMQTFLKSNTGLVSRFNKFIAFPDYSREELLDILDSMAQKAGLILQGDAKIAARRYLCRLTKEERKEFGNARGIRNLFEKIVMNQANRLVKLDQPTREDLMQICKEDVEAV